MSITFRSQSPTFRLRVNVCEVAGTLADLGALGWLLSGQRVEAGLYPC